MAKLKTVKITEAKKPLKYVGYYRVSTKKQGLGLEAQKEVVKEKAKENNAKVVEEFVEVESGKKNSRVKLEEAIEYCKEHESVLVIAKLDRLSRDVEFIFKLRNSGLDFLCCDLPDFNTLTLGMFASFAQYERERISERTKAALAVLKKNGKTLGRPKGQPGCKTANHKNRRRKAMLSSESIYLLAIKLRKEGKTYKNIVEELASLKIKNPVSGKQLTISALQHFIKLHESKKE